MQTRDVLPSGFRPSKVTRASTFNKGKRLFKQREALLRHSGLKFVTPIQRHDGDDVKILEQRKHVCEQAKKMYSERWSGKTQNWNYVVIVKLNPANEQALNSELKKTA